MELRRRLFMQMVGGSEPTEYIRIKSSSASLNGATMSVTPLSPYKVVYYSGGIQTTDNYTASDTTFTCFADANTDVMIIGSFSSFGFASSAAVEVEIHEPSLTSITSSGNAATLTSVDIFDTSIPSLAIYQFDGCSSLQTLLLPDSLTKFGHACCRNCSALSSITIPHGAVAFGWRCFYNCTGLTSIYYKGLLNEWISSSGQSSNTPLQYAHHLYVMDNNDEYYLVSGAITVTSSNNGNSAFYGCTDITSITFDNSVTYIGNFFAAQCTALTSITIGSNVTSIGEYAFHGDTGITSVSFPNTLQSIGTWAFFGCSGLQSLTIPASVITISSLAFNGIGISTLTLNSNAYYAWTEVGRTINSITIGSTATKWFFDNNDILYWSDNNTQICVYCYVSKTLTNISILPGTTKIEKDAMRGCNNIIGTLTLPSGLTTIDSNAFYYTSISGNLTIPASVTSLGAGAFMRTNLNGELYFKGDAVIGYRAFQTDATGFSSMRLSQSTPPNFFGTTINITATNPVLYVPSGSLAAYQASQWASWATGGIVEY